MEESGSARGGSREKRASRKPSGENGARGPEAGGPRDANAPHERDMMSRHQWSIQGSMKRGRLADETLRVWASELTRFFSAMAAMFVASLSAGCSTTLSA